MSILFNEDLGSTSNRKGLIKLQNKFSGYDPSYVSIASMDTLSGFRKWLEFVWKQYKPYSDTNFPNEFKKQFSQRTWELYLGVALLNRGYTLGEHRDVGPDFKIPLDDKNSVWIEAISVKKGDGQDKVPEIKYGKAIDVPEKEMLLRLTSGLGEKYQKYLSYLQSNIIKSNDSFVIAIDRSDLQHTDPQIPLIFKCLFAIGHQVLLINSTKPRPKTEGSNWSSREKVNKMSGNEVPMLLFRNSDFESVSAIIYCTTNILNSPRNPKYMGNNFVVVHNPFAKNPLPENFIKFGEEWKLEGDQLKKIQGVRRS